MASLDDPGVRLLLREQVHPVISSSDEEPYDDVEVKGAVTSTTEGADAHVDRLAEYLGVDSYTFRSEGEQRINRFLQPTRVRHQKQR